MKKIIYGLLLLMSCMGCQFLTYGREEVKNKFVEIKIVSQQNISNNGTDIYLGKLPYSKMPVLIRLDCPAMLGGTCSITTFPIVELNICKEQE